MPLRVFEPRYRRLLADVTADGGARRFGVVALTAGLEVDTGLDDATPQFADVGTVAEVLEVRPAPDDTIELLTGGSQRFRIEQLIDAPTPYVQAEVRFCPRWPAAAVGAAGREPRARREYARLLGELTGRRVEPSEPYPSDPILLSYRLGAEAPLSQADCQQLLEDETATARLLHVQRVLRREVMLLRRLVPSRSPPLSSTSRSVRN